MSLLAKEAPATLLDGLGEGSLDVLDVPSDDGDVGATGCGRTGGIGSWGRLADDGRPGAALPDKEDVDRRGTGDHRQAFTGGGAGNAGGAGRGVR